MRHPVLHIKKNATIYDDHESEKEMLRLSYPALQRLRESRPRRPRKRRMGLSTASLLIVAIGMFLVLRQVPRGGVPRVTFDGWQVILRATPHEELIIVGVTFIAEARGGAAAQAQSVTTAASPLTPKASISITLTGTDQHLDLEGALDRSPMTLRGELPFPPEAKRVQAEVMIGTDIRTLWIAAPRVEKD